MTSQPIFITDMEHDASNDAETKKALEKLALDPPCSMPWQHILVDRSGDVSVCCLNSYVVGNLHDAPLEDLWNGPSMCELRRRFLNHDYSSCSVRCPFVLARVKAGKAQKNT